MDFGDRLLLALAFAVVAGVVRGVFYLIGSPAERAARELRDTHDRALAHQHHHRAVEDVASKSERRAAELIDEFPKLGDVEIATLMHDELANMRSAVRAYYEWATPANIARVRRTMAVNAIRAQRSAGDDVDVDI